MSSTRKTVGLFWRHVKKYPRYAIGLTIALPITILLQYLPAIIAAGVLDKLSHNNFNPDDLWASFGDDILIYALLVMLGGIVAWRVVVILIWKLESYVMRDISRQVFNHLMSMSAQFHANKFGGSLVSQTNRLTGAYVRFQDTTVFNMAPLVLSFIFTAIILLPRAPLYVAALFGFSAMFMLFATLSSRKIRDLSAAEATASNKQTGILADALTNIMAVKSFAAGRNEQNRYYDSSEASRLAALNVMRAAIKRDLAFSSITTTLTVLSLCLAIASVTMFKGDIATVFLVLNYTGGIVQQLWEFAHSSLRQYNRAIGDAKEMIEILDIAPDVKDPANPQKARITSGAINFKNVSFTHGDSKDALFTNLNISIKAGEKVGLVGHSGSGKTTLTKLLLRFADVNDGSIKIDGQNINHLTQDTLRQYIAYVPQEPLLFHRTISENIAYGELRASKKSIIQAAKDANAHEFISKLPKGYDTLVGERGVKLSGGQRQRVAIARAMLKTAPILVLDEATSALDSESEKLIQQALWRLMRNRTTIVIAHRLSTIQRMDRIIVLSEGKIIEQGSHTELLANNGTYATLWAHQSGGFIEE